MAILVVCVALLASEDAHAACEEDLYGCYIENADERCETLSVCVDPGYGPCKATGASSESCTVCGRYGTVKCTTGTSGGRFIAGSCSAHAPEICNGCDDDGDGLVDENSSNSGPLTNGTCSSSVGCPGTSTCVNGSFQCVYQVGARRTCTEMLLCESPTAECRADGTTGPCQPPTSRPETCNGCDDNRDGFVDNNPEQGNSTLTRECTSSAGVCLGSNQVCSITTSTDGYVLGEWSACIAPAEACNGADDDCDGKIDEDGICRTDTATCSCVPVTCAQVGKNCGVIDDGCGWPLNCGTCPSGTTCGGSGIPNVCSGCTPLPQAQACLGKCGTVSDGCHGSYDCGGCTSPQTCGGGGTPNVCGCTPTPQATACSGKSCGSVPDGCGGTYSCGGSCASPQTCGGGGTPNVCGCTPTPQATACAGKNCGTVPNGCGGTYSCGGSCTSPQTCGGGGTANVCGCTPKTQRVACGTRQCGPAADGCGEYYDCGECFEGEYCVNGTCR